MTQEQQGPRTKHKDDEFPTGQQQDQPGLTGLTRPDPDHGEDSYVGHDRLTGKRALITGGDSGIGRAVAIAFAREGADVAIVHLPEETEDAETTASHVREAGRNVALYAQDLRAEGAAEQIVRRTLEDLGGIDVLILNAAYQRKRGGIDETPIEEVQKVFDTNLISHIALAKEAVPHLPEGSSIITTTSIQAAGPAPPLFDYAMTKAAQVAFTEVLAQELTPKGIRVNAVAPGPIWAR